MLGLERKVIIITGASSGIGYETALALGAQKALLVLAGRRKERLEEVARRVESGGGTALVVAVDIGEEQQARQLIEAAVEKFGRIDVLINNAGTGLYATVEETTPAQMERIWKTNFLGTFYCIRNTLPVMRKQNSGHIITVSSLAGKRGTPFMGAYCATKFAQNGLMDSLRRETANSGIRCSVIYPGSTETEFIAAMENPGQRKIQHSGPIQKPSAVAKAIVNAIQNPSPEVITQRLGRILIVLNALSPRFTDWLVERTVKRGVTTTT